MDKENINRVLMKILDHTPEVKLRAGKQYAHGRTEPGGLISVAALKDRMRVSFITEGKGNDISANRFLEWVNDSGVMRTKAFNENSFLLSEGAKNTDKREVCAEITYETRTEDEIVTDTITAYSTLLGKLSGFFEPKVFSTAELNAQPDEEMAEYKEIALTFLYSNGDTGEQFDEGEEGSAYIVTSQSSRLQESLNNWLARRDEESLKQFMIDLIGDPEFNGCDERGVAFNELKEVFFWRGVDKLGWGDVMVQVFGIVVDGDEIELSDLEMETLGEECKVQLERGADPGMYMIDCAL